MLEFNIKNQTISRVDRFNPATDSVDYLTAKFNFITTDWDGVTKKALFRSGTVSYEAAISASGVCKVPFEVLVSPGNKFSALSGGCIKIFVSVVGTSGTMTIPTKECRVEIGASGLNETLNGATPTPNIYEQFVDTIKADNDTTVAEIKADNDETRAEVEALTERAETAQTSAEQSAASMKNDYANALKCKASGEVVRVDDVSPVEHNPVVKVHGKNYFNYKQMDFENRDLGLIDNGDGSITVNTPSGSSGVSAKATLRQLAPALKVGNIYTLSFDSNGIDKYIYLSKSQSGWNNRIARVITENDLASTVFLYASGVNTTATISNIQIEEGDTATEYTPYIDPSTVTLTRCGKNILPPNYLDGLERIHNGVTFTAQEDGGIKAVGTATDYAYFKVMQTDISNLPYVATDCLFDDNNKYTFVPVPNGETVNKVYYPQVEIGAVATDYEKPQEQVTYTPEADGSCDIISLSPTMTLLTDTEGVTVECEYNRDINKVIADLYNKLNG